MVTTLETHKRELVAQAVKGNQAAIELVDHIACIIRVWDDLVDGNKPVLQEDVNEAFWRALVEVPRNPLFKAKQDEITALFREYFNDWFDANSMEKDNNEHHKHISFILRDMIGSLVSHLAYYVGGYEHMRKFSMPLRAIQFDEPLSQYMEGLKDGALRR